VQASRQATPALAGRWSALEPYLQQAKAKQVQETAEEAMKKAEEKARNDAYNKMPWYKKGLVNALDNPVAELVTGPAVDAVGTGQDHRPGQAGTVLAPAAWCSRVDGASVR
jgi:hypothetical protein